MRVVTQGGSPLERPFISEKKGKGARRKRREEGHRK
jgi:hypothetical protein